MENMDVWYSCIILYVIYQHASAQQCYDLTCSGEGCLAKEVTSNPLLIPKCSRIFYRGCFTVKTSTRGYTTTTTGCLDREFECKTGTCSSLVVKAEVTCCNSDLCNDGMVPSRASRALSLNLVLLLITMCYSL